MATATTSINKTGGGAEPADAVEPLSFDETVKAALTFCGTLPKDFAPCGHLLAELQTRLSKGRLHFAVLGQFNRGKSTFINALLRINALPTSVLPLTSVPTLIEYGAEAVCKIRFLDGREDLVVPSASGGMESALRQYVAEASNPKNRLGVRDATLTCASDLLANGTVLIDTPGFGSTHLHNTQTTLDLLAECDAALFLLSADPPMTQTEMEFLRQVRERIPKLYFILNKVDLLSPPELRDVEGFILGILSGELGFPSDITLYRACAVKAERADSGKEGDNVWEQSGLGAVKREVLDFMVREKYFTLSEALSGKYKEIVADIMSRLRKRLDDITAPIAAAQQELSAITGAIQSLSIEMESQTRQCAEEREALTAKLDALAKENRERCAMSIKKTLDTTLGGRYLPAEAAGIAATTLPKNAADAGAGLLNDMVEAANKSIRAIALHHALTLANLQKRHIELLKGGGIVRQEAETFVEQAEITPQNHAKIFEAAAVWGTPATRSMDIFKKKSARLGAIRAFYEPVCNEYAAANMDKAAKHGRLLCNGAWEKLQIAIRASYKEMIDYLKQLHAAKQEKLYKTQEGIKGETAFLKEKIKECPAPFGKV
ncbi:MAG: dynamin family protein [Chitinispirillales bacterium]|nr:dynamin family protein [Chitinispirillales bacterium]